MHLKKKSRPKQKLSTSCKVKLCKSNPGPTISFFRFPIKDEELMKQWIASGLPLGKISQYSRICSNHFSPEDYTVIYQAKRILKKDAVPKLNNEPAPILFDPETMILVDSIGVGIEEENKTEITEECSEPPTKKMCTISVQTKDDYLEVSDQEIELRRQVKSLKSRLTRMTKKVVNTANLILHLHQTDKCIDAIENGLLTGVSDFNLEILKNEHYNHGLSRKHASYTDEMKEFSWKLYNYSADAYEYVRTKINLPHLSTLKKWRKSLDGELSDSSDSTE